MSIPIFIYLIEKNLESKIHPKSSQRVVPSWIYLLSTYGEVESNSPACSVVYGTSFSFWKAAQMNKQKYSCFLTRMEASPEREQWKKVGTALPKMLTNHCERMLKTLDFLVEVLSIMHWQLTRYMGRDIHSPLKHFHSFKDREPRGVCMGRI